MAPVAKFMIIVVSVVALLLSTFGISVNAVEPDVDRAQIPKRADELLRELLELEQQGRRMQPYRNSAGFAECGRHMRSGQARAKQLQAEAESLPMEIRMGFGVAAINLNMCVSCIDDALDYCNMAKGGIKDAKASLAKYKAGKI